MSVKVPKAVRIGAVRGKFALRLSREGMMTTRDLCQRDVEGEGWRTREQQEDRISREKF